ncbi:MAG: SDR family NAD(P)-dependent oxidoreductase, partial [Alphaproteobacteria bacterium]|nr:SDR family NAD(P)-dependent oxidoreductase [Alphaproteobacteria bacterium]
MAKLDGRIAIVTGAGRGVGRMIAAKLGGEGARVIVNDLDSEPAEAVAGEIVSAGGDARALAGDVTAPDFADTLIALTLAQFGDLHIVINNAGYIWN